MALRRDTEEFKKWAAKLGISADHIPKDDLLKSLLKSNQYGLIMGLTEKIRPRQEVEEIRKNILVNKMKKIKPEIVSTYSRNHLPIELRRHLEIEDLKLEKHTLESEIVEYKKQYNELADSIKTKNLEKLRIQQENDGILTKMSILEEKLELLNENIEKEQMIKEKILMITPVKPNSENTDSTLALDTVNDALKHLNDFYKIYLGNSDDIQIREAHNELWKNLRRICNKVPNYILWNTLLQLKDKQLECLKGLNQNSDLKTSLKSIDSGINTTNSIEAFELNLLKAEASIISTISQIYLLKKEGIELSKHFVNSYTKFFDEIYLKIMSLQSSSTEINSATITLSNYIIEYKTFTTQRSQIEFIKNELEKYKKLIEDGNFYIDNHRKLMLTLNGIYDEIALTINRIQYEVKQLNGIKEKIIYCKDLSRILASSLSKEYGNNDSLLNCTMNKMETTIDSFDSLCSSDILCSTKLDCNTSPILSSSGGLKYDPNTSTNMNTVILPSYVNELTTFNDLAVRNFSICIPKKCISYLIANPMLMELSENLSSCTQLYFLSSLLTFEGFVKEIEDHCALYSKLQTINKEIKFNTTITKVDRDEINTRKYKKEQEIIEILNNIKISSMKTKYLKDKFRKYYEFFINCPLRKYVPPAELVNGEKYSKYESEYLMFYRMAQSSKSFN